MSKRKIVTDLIYKVDIKKFYGHLVQLLTKQEILGSIPRFAVEFLPNGKLFHSMYGFSVLVFQCQCSVLYCLQRRSSRGPSIVYIFLYLDHRKVPLHRDKSGIEGN